MIKFINKLSKLLGVGTHAVTIMAAALAMAAANAEYGDRTPQLEVKFKKGDKQFTNWYNLKGFVAYEDLSAEQKASGKFRASKQGYAISVETGRRIEDEKKTEEALGIIGKLGHDCGLRGEMSTIEEVSDALIGKEVGIVIKANGQGADRVTFSTSVKYAKEQEALEV